MGLVCNGDDRWAWYVMEMTDGLVCNGADRWAWCVMVMIDGLGV